MLLEIVRAYAQRNEIFYLRNSESYVLSQSESELYPDKKITSDQEHSAVPSVQTRSASQQSQKILPLLLSQRRLQKQS